MEARCVFIDGPVAVYVSEESAEAILAAYTRLGKLVQIAAGRFNPEPEPSQWPALD